MEHEQAFPDIGSMNDEELKGMIEQLTNEEREVSYRRRLLHGQIDLMRAELVNRLKTKRKDGQSLLSGSDVEQLTEILLGKVPTAPDEDDGEGGGEPG
ncbi:MAG: hypothetical protein M3383_01850 [Actinomycetota bacterium]|nr:hypothetical protein [Actinomycetota bacterium]